MGETLDTVPLHLLTKLATRAILLSRSWDTGTARVREFFDFSVPDYDRVYGTEGFTRLPTLFASFLPGNQWILFGIDKRPSLYCLKSGAHLSLDVPGDITSFAFDTSNNGAEVVLAALVMINRGPGIEYERYVTRSLYLSFALKTDILGTLRYSSCSLIARHTFKPHRT